MESHHTHCRRDRNRLPSLIDLTAEGFCRNDPTPGSVLLLQVVVGALLMLGVALIGLQVG
jgi:hypothetical protein